MRSAEKSSAWQPWLRTPDPSPMSSITAPSEEALSGVVLWLAGMLDGVAPFLG